MNTCWAIVNILLTVHYITKPAGNVDNITVKESEFEVIDGKIKLNKRFSTPGIKELYGYLFFDNNGDTDSLLVDTQFYVIPKPNEAIVSPVNMQVFYIGLRNEIAVAFPGIADLTSIRVNGKNGTILKTDSIETIIPCFEGLMTILKEHIPLVTFLRPGFVEVKIDNKTEKFYVEEGIVEFSNNILLILSETAKNVKDFKSEEILKLIEDTKLDISNKNISDKENYILSYKIETLNQLN